MVMGGAKVGKSSIISQFLYGTFSPKYKRTVEEMHLGEFNVGGVRLTLEILDTAGDTQINYDWFSWKIIKFKLIESLGYTKLSIIYSFINFSGSFEFPAMRALSISSADAFVLVYSVVDPDTFEEARVIRDQILEIKGGAQVPIVIVGNKTDLIEDDSQQVKILLFSYLIFLLIELSFLLTQLNKICFLCSIW